MIHIYRSISRLNSNEKYRVTAIPVAPVFKYTRIWFQIVRFAMNHTLQIINALDVNAFKQFKFIKCTRT